MSSNGVLRLDAVRAAAAAALAPTGPDDPDVHVDVVDAVSPPAILLVWDDPWLEADTYGVCLFRANLTVLCIAARLEPGPGVARLEEMVALVIGRLYADTYDWPRASSQAPRLYDIGGVPHLGARVSYSVPVQIGGP